MSNNMSYVFDLSCIDVKCEQSTPGEAQLPASTFPTGKPEFRQPTSDEVILYYYPLSYYSQVVLMALYHRQIPFTGCALDIRRGDQFTPEFLTLSPRGEVPVLQDGINERTYTDSLQILHHLEHDPMLGAQGYSLHPEDPQEQFRCEEFARKLHRLKLDTLTFGSVLFNDLNIEPQGQFASEANREKMREYIRKRRAIYRTEALNFPEHSGTLKRKLDDIQHEWHFIEKREDYETLLISVEHELDECEAELASRHHRGHHPSRRGSMLGTDTWWLCSHEVCIADIFLGILVWRLFELGFYKRMIEPRPYLTKYFERLQRVDSFGRATHPTVVDTTTIDPNQSGKGEKRVPWYLLMIPIGTMLVYAIWGYSIRRRTNQYGFYTVAAAACIYARWCQDKKNAEHTKALKRH